MRYLITILLFFVTVSLYAQLPTTPGTQPRSLPANNPQDYNLWPRNQFGIPRFNDTTQANSNTTLDTAGRVIWTYNTNWFWGRQTYPYRRWVPFNNSSNLLNPTCGSANGTHLVTWDSLLTFDVSGGPFVSCCDGVPRFTNNTSITLDTNSTDFQRIDLIILDTTGVNWIKGTPSLNPSTPNTNSCQTVLSYVLINAHDSVPAFLSPTNPLIIYDENYNTEWVNDSSGNLVMDTANLVFPVHLTHSISITSFTSNPHFFFTTSTPIDLNNYTIFKFYDRRISVSAGLALTFTWYLGNVQQTFPVTFTLPSLTGYSANTIALSGFRILNGTQVDRLKVSITGSSQTFYLDWIQLQNGAIISNPGSTGTVTSVGAGNLPPLFTTTVTNSTSTPLINFFQQTACSHCVFFNPGNTAAFPVFDTLDVSVVTGQLNVTNIETGCNGCVITNIGGTNIWSRLIRDTTYLFNWAYRHVDPFSANDSLSFGDRHRDSAILSFDTYASLNSHFVKYTQGTADVLTLNANGANNGLVQIGASRFEPAMGVNVVAANNLTLGPDGNVFTITGSTQINAITTANWQAGSTPVTLIFTGTPVVKNNTAGGAGTAPLLLAGSVDYTAAVNDVLTLVYDGTNWHESSRKTSTTISSQTLQQTFNTEVGGSVMTKPDSMLFNSSGLSILNSSTSNVFTLKLTSAGNNGGILSMVGTGTNTLGLSMATTGVGISVNSTGNTAIQGVTTANASGVAGTVGGGASAYGGFFSKGETGTNLDSAAVKILTTSTGTAANGLGTGIDFYVETISSSAGDLSNKIISKWTDATTATRTSQLDITGINSAAPQTIMSAYGTGVVGIGISASYNATRLDVVDNSNIASQAVRISSTGTAGNNLLLVSAAGSTTGIVSLGVSGAAVIGQVSGTGTGGTFSSNTGFGLQASSNSSPFSATNGSSVTNATKEVAKFNATTSGTAAAGIGGYFDFITETDDGAVTNRSNTLEWSLTSTTAASRTSKMKLTGMLSGTQVDLVTFNGDGSWDIRPITATAASAITPSEGKVVFVSSTDATFTSIGFWGYQNGAWHAF